MWQTNIYKYIYMKNKIIVREINAKKKSKHCKLQKKEKNTKEKK